MPRILIVGSGDVSIGEPVTILSFNALPDSKKNNRGLAGDSTLGESMREFQIIRKRREELGLSEQEMATLLGSTLESYYDLEGFESSELHSNLSIAEVCQLANVLKMRPIELVSQTKFDKGLSLDSVAEKVKELITEENTVEVLGKEVGWDLQSLFLTRTERAHKWCIDGIRDVCDQIGLDWRSVLDGECALLTLLDRSPRSKEPS